MKVEQESETFYDPYVEEYEGEYDQEYYSQEEQEESGENENDSETKPESKISLPSADYFHFDDVSEENAWANEEFGLEAALQKSHSQIQREEKDALQVRIETPPAIIPPQNEPIKEEMLSSPISPTKQELPLEESFVSTEIKNLALGNSQQMETAKIVETIVSKAPLNGRSKFFDLGEEQKCDEDMFSNNTLQIFSDLESNLMCLMQDKLEFSDPHTNTVHRGHRTNAQM